MSRQGGMMGRTISLEVPTYPMGVDQGTLVPLNHSHTKC